jgi:hypothetical protein
MATLIAMVIVPDKFINRKILAAARGTHDTSPHVIPYCHTS